MQKAAFHILSIKSDNRQQVVAAGFRSPLISILSMLLLLFALTLPSLAAAAPQGASIINSVELSTATLPTIRATSTVRVLVPTPATIEFLQYAPTIPGTTAYPVVQGSYRPGANPLLPFSALSLPQTTGSTPAIDISQPVPLFNPPQIHQGDALFIRVTDPDQNIDSTIRDIIFVTITNPANGDTEVVLLTETGVNSGTFLGYIPTGQGNAQPYNGIMTVGEGQRLNARYIDPDDGTDTATTAIMVDPFGIFLDTQTGLPLDDATITMIDVATGLPAKIFGDDGISSYPSTIVSGKGATDTSGRTYTFPAGMYRFPYIMPGTYRFEIIPPAGYSAPTLIDTATIQKLPGAPFAIVNGSRGEAFVINPGPALRIDIPLDPVPISLWVQKSAGKELAGHGDFVPYQVSVTNLSERASVADVRIFDTLPVGFRLRKGSVLIGERAGPDPVISADGRTLAFSVGAIAARGTITIKYVVEVTAGARLGGATNLARATGARGTKSNIAKVTIKVQDDFLRSRSILMGRITTGVCDRENGDGSDGVEGMRVYLEDGTYVVSDRDGLFHFEAVKPGLHVVQLDLDTLPEGYEAIACTENSRFAGRAFSQFVETQGGTLWRTDFHIARKQQPVTETGRKSATGSGIAKTVNTPRRGNVSLELANTLQGEHILYRVTIRGGAVPRTSVRLNVILPEGVSFQPDSSRSTIGALQPPSVSGQILSFTLGDMAVDWQQEITFKARHATDAKTGGLNTRAYIVSDLSNGALLTTPAETALHLAKEEDIQRLPDVVMHPRFPTFGAELNDSDRRMLDELANILRGLRTEKIHVTGHTDNVPISQRGKKQYRDNVALSMGRAKSVGRYLMEQLHFPPEKLSLDGRGEFEPVASNRTPAGRAMNRRVEVRISTNRVVERSQLTVLREISSKQGEIAEENAEDPRIEAQQSGNVEKTAAVSSQASSGTEVSQSTELLPARGLLAETATPAKVKQTGIISLTEGQLLTNPVIMVHASIPSALTPKLTVDGIEIPTDQIGMRSQNSKTGLSQISYLGVRIDKPGSHTITLQGMDPFGNQRFSDAITVVRTGRVSSIRVTSDEGNVADGLTPVRIRLELKDEDGNILKGATELELKDGVLKPLLVKGAGLENKVTGKTVKVDAEGWASFHPVSASGSYRIVLAQGSTLLDTELYVKPKMRDWILVGLGEGTVGYNTVTGNLESMTASDATEDFYKDGRVAFFAKGQIKGEWLLTMSYDSKKTRTNGKESLFQNINPDTYYTLYGDATQQGYDAASTQKIYVRIERDQFSAMFGDFDTGLSVTELSRYSRRMTGGKTEYKSKYFEVNAFGAQTDQAYARDEIPGDGTSGIYRLTRKPIVPNSEKITIEVRDRFRSEIVISSKSMGRFSEYSIDYDTGAIFFKEPVFSRDEKFNPVTIVAEYETAGSDLDYTYGGRAGVKLFNGKLKTGFTHIHEGQGDRKSELFGGDTAIQLGEATRIRGEIAATTYKSSIEKREGRAYLTELTHRTRRFDARLYFRDQETGFGLGQQSGSEAGTRKMGVEAQYRMTEHFSTSANLYRQYTFLSNTVRDVADAKINYAQKGYGAYVGYQHATDRLTDGTRKTSGQITLGGRISTFKDRLALTVDHAQSVLKNENTDFPTRTTLGLEVKAHRNLTLLAAQEFTWGKAANTMMTRLGMKSTLWEGGTVSSSVERQFNENDERVFANVGLKQTWQVTEAWKVDAGLDRSQLLMRAPGYQANSAVPPASGSSENFTAISTGATYQVKHLTWDTRLESRFARSEDKWGVLTGVVNEVSRQWAWSAKAQFMQTYAESGIKTSKGNLRYGLVFRPPRTKWIFLNRLDLLIDKQSGSGSSDMTSWRVINNLSANYRPYKKLQVSLKYGAKFVIDTIYGRRYSGFTDHTGLEGRYDITKQWDIGLRASVLHSWHGGQYAYSFGPSLGYNMVENVWLGVGYNVWGFTDKDFSAADYTAQGPYFRFRMKIDQQTVKDAAGWLNKE